MIFILSGCKTIDELWLEPRPLGCYDIQLLLPSAEQRCGAANHELRLVKLPGEQLLEKRSLVRAEHLLGALHHPIVQLAEFVSKGHKLVVAKVVIPMLEIPFSRIADVILWLEVQPFFGHRRQ